MKNDRGLYTPRIGLRDLHLQGAILGHAKLQGALFSGAHLDYVDTRTSTGPYADLRLADFQGATLFGAYLNNANLAGAKRATPRRADGKLRAEQTTLLRFASLRGANLAGADLSGADLTDVRVGGAELVGARYNLRTAWPDGRWVSGQADSDQRTGRLCRVKSCLAAWQVVKTGTFPAS